MLEWILIPTMAANGNQGGKSIAVIPKFYTKEDCMAAGAAWLKNVEPLWGTDQRALCVARRVP